MKLSTRGRYAFRMMLELALNEQGRPVLLREIARKQNMSTRYLEQLSHNLKNAGLIKSIRGKQGGFLLNRPPEKITLLDIFQASEGMPVIVDCVEDPGVCRKNSQCATQEIWKSISRLITDLLARQTLAELAERHKAMMSVNQVTYHI